MEFKILHRRRAHQKKMVLTVKSSGDIVLSSNLSVSLTTIRLFLTEQLPWLRRHVSKTKELQLRRGPSLGFTAGETFYFLGQNRSLVFKQNLQRRTPHLSLQGENFIIEASPDFFKEREKVRRLLQLFFRRYAKAYLPSRLEHWQQQMGVSVTGLSIKSQNSVWGSCSSRGRINLNMRLLVFSPEYIDYVIVHELAHLTHPNHSPRFWAEVASYDAEFKKHKKFIREHQFWADFLSGEPRG